MSKLVENALERVQKTTWYFDRGVLEIRDAVLIFTNFAGQANRFGNTSKTFNVVLPNDLKEFLEECQLHDKALHVNIHKYPNAAAETDEEPCVYYINVKVNMDSEFPPQVTLYVNQQTTDDTGATIFKKSHVSLQDATIGCLDRVDMDRADCKLNLKESKANPGNAVFYLRQLNVIQTKIPDFGGVYDDWENEEIEANPAIVAANEDIDK